VMTTYTEEGTDEVDNKFSSLKKCAKRVFNHPRKSAPSASSALQLTLRGA
jgi:hypothetical protein